MNTTDNQSHLENKVVILNGFSKEEIFAIMKMIKKAYGPSQDIMFAMTTEHSLQMKLKDVISDVSEEHAYMKAHPPKKTNTPVTS
jgi:predicted amidohydrolase